VALPSSANASASAARTVARALAEGRKLANEGRWQEAVEALEVAAAGEPPNPYALSELGWAALHAGDLDRSLSASERGLALTEEPKARATLLYNRGRVQEDRGLKEEARASYEQSLELRPNDAVKKRLEGLGGKAPPPPERKVVCDKAYDTVREACGCLIGARKELGLPTEPAASCASLPVDSALDGRPIEIVRIAAGSESVIWVLADVKGRLRPVGEVASGEIAAKKLMAPLEGDSTVVSLLFERTSTDTGKAVRTTSELLCLVGDRKGAPACPLAVPHAIAELKHGAPSPARTVTLARTIRASGKVEVKQQGGPKDLIPPGALGSHALW
jgi:tetratricopeptide (TPR) repeat protein